MAIADIVAKVAEPAFYTKVYFLAVKVSQNVAAEAPSTPNHDARVKYAARVFMGEESATSLAMHVVASNGTIQNTITAGDEPPDSDLEFALASIWDARALALV